MSSTTIKTFRKTAAERRRLYIDYSCWLEDVESLNGISVVASPYTEASPIAVNSGYTDGTQKKVVIFVSGGVSNTSYILTLVAQTTAGQIKQDDIGLRVS